MTGIEIAGLVLAVLPVLVSAFEHYNDGINPLKAAVRWDSQLPRLIRKIRNQHVHYEQTLMQLLGPLVAENQLAEMVARPNGDL